jgi:hypothetical protein
MKAQLELNTDSRIFPDANSTLRVTYGKVKGYEPKMPHFTLNYLLDGVMEKYIPGDYEFDVPKKLVDCIKRKSMVSMLKMENACMFYRYQSYHWENSGSPAIDANGNLIA